MKVRITIAVDQSEPEEIYQELSAAFEQLKENWDHLVDGVVCGAEGELAFDDDRFSFWHYDPTSLAVAPGLTIAELVTLIRQANSAVTSIRLSGKKEVPMVLAVVRGDHAQKLEQFLQELENE